MPQFKANRLPEFEVGYSSRVTEPIRTVPGYQWIVVDRDLLGGQPPIKGTRLSVAHILACLGEGMRGVDICAGLPWLPARIRTRGPEIRC